MPAPDHPGRPCVLRGELSPALSQPVPEVGNAGSDAADGWFRRIVCPNIESVLSENRQLAWPALLTARDLGGLPTENSTTRFGAVVRSDSLHRLTDAGWADLEAYGVATIIDTRAPNECRVRPIRVRGAVDYRNVPLLDDVALARVARRFDVEG